MHWFRKKFQNECTWTRTFFAIGRELIVDVPINHQGYTVVYIDDTAGLIFDLP
jgi:hypothetical protein